MRIGDPDPIYTVTANSRRILSRIAKKHGLTLEQVTMLIFLKSEGESTQQNGNKKSGYHRETWRRIVISLVDLGFVDVDTSEKEYVYFLSPKGDYVMRGYSLLMRRALSGG